MNATAPAAALFSALLFCGPALASDAPGTVPSDEPAPGAAPATAPVPRAPDYEPGQPPKIHPKNQASAAADGAGDVGLLAPDVNVIDDPTAAVLDYGGYSSQSRFYRGGGLLEYASFGVYNGINIGASMAVDGLIGDSKDIRARAPAAQVKWRIYDGDRWIPAVAVGYDGQGWDYNSVDHRYNQKQRGGYIVASQELGIPGLMVHPEFNISDFNTNSFYGALPFSYNIKDKVALLLEWDNISNFVDSRVNAGLRVYVTPHFDVDFAVRAIGQGGHFDNGDPRGPERIVQLRYVGNF